MGENDRPLSRYQCEHCDLRPEVANVKDFVKDVNARQWWGITFAIATLVTSVGTLLVIIFKMLPAIAMAQAAVK